MGYVGTVIIALSIMVLPVTQAVSDRHLADVKAKKDYLMLKSRCTSSSDERAVLATGAARSQMRLDAVTKHFQRLIAAPCLQSETLQIYRNPYLGIRLDALSPGTSTGLGAKVLDGILFDLDYGLGAFLSNGGTLCQDGWISSSRGQGSCSHHGGYAHARGIALNFEGGEPILNPFPVDRELGNPAQLVTGPLSILREAIFNHLLHNPKFPVSLLGFILFLFVATWPLVVIFTLSNRMKIKDRETDAARDLAQAVAMTTNPEMKLQAKPTLPRIAPLKAVPKRTYKPKTSSQPSSLDNYAMVAWLNVDEVSALVRANTHKTEQQIFGAAGRTGSWVRVRSLGITEEDDFEFGLERSNLTGVHILGWFSDLEVGLLHKAIESGEDCHANETPGPPSISAVYIGPYATDGIAGQPSVRLYKLRSVRS